MGQNIRLASEVTGYVIDAIKRSDYELSESETIYLENIAGLTDHNWKLLYSMGIETAEELLNTSREELISIKGMGEKTVDKIIATVTQAVEQHRAELKAAQEARQAQMASSESQAEEAESQEAEEFELTDEEVQDDLIQE